MKRHYVLILIALLVFSCKKEGTSTSEAGLLNLSSGNSKTISDVVSFFKQKGVSFDRNNTEFDPSLDVVLTLQDLERLKQLPQLIHVGIPKGMDDRVLDIIATLSNLEYLSVSSSNITDKGLVKINNLNKLRFIDLSSTNITDASLKILKQFPNIERIHLDSTKITDEGLKNLIGLANLYEISLNQNSITDKGLMYLSNIKSLRAIHVFGTKVTLEGYHKFVKALPSISEINFDY